ncbi:uncharacterized protein LOC105844131 [Hydra vulgaris]|uniref:uncharacterized protein LOC105844131 n=1 Tax=Hydra vulgaris TaxID=6087 RepID=UPI001F5F2299|nr:uncharacterized protein LOC105844131 [Hydra vulgaris]
MSEKKRLSVKKNKESQRKAILKYFRAETHSTGTDSATESDSGVSKKSKVIVDDKTVNNANISNQQNEVVNINENQIYLPEATPAVNISRQIETETQISILSSAIVALKSSLPALEGSGLNDWKNIIALLSSHEKSNSHLVNFQMWKELHIRLSSEKIIDHINQQKINEKEQYWQRVLERLIALVRVLAAQNLAFCGTNEKLYNNANESPTSHDGDLVKIKEHFLGFIPVEKSTGGFLAKTLIEQLENFNLPIENLRGQGYDNGSNMKGKEKGIYSYFSGSPSRWQVFRSYFPDFTVKSLNDTRWESRINALKPLRYNLGKIYNALMQIFEDPRLQTTSVGNSSRNEAKWLANSICIFKFMVTLVSWYDILFEVNISNKILQNKKVDLNVATQQLNVTKNKLVKMRNDEGFQRIIVDAAEIAKELETVTNFEEKHVGRRRKKRQFDYETQDKTLQDPKEKFKVEFYFKILDTAIQSIAERFEQMRQYNSMFGFLYDIYSISSKSSAELLKNCRNLEEILTHGSQKDISAADLCNEIKVLSGSTFPQQMIPHEVLTFIVEQRLIDCLPNICGIINNFDRTRRIINIKFERNYYYL